jgi:glycosyltransferase involved in cell wall biosynthesis
LDEARGKGVDGCVRYCGPRQLEELVREIADCDVGIIPNRRSDFAEINTPTRIFEYLARGKPVIAPRTAGIEDYFKPDSLLFFEPGNAEELAQQIQFVWTNSGEALRTTERGQAVFLEHRWAQERDTLVSLVGELLNGKK